MNQKFWAKQAKLITDTSAILDTSGVLGGEEEEDAPPAAQLRVYDVTNPYEPIRVETKGANEQHLHIVLTGGEPPLYPGSSAIPGMTLYRVRIGAEARRRMQDILKYSNSLGDGFFLGDQNRKGAVFHQGQETIFFLYCDKRRGDKIQELQFMYALNQPDEPIFRDAFTTPNPQHAAVLQIPSTLGSWIRDFMARQPPYYLFFGWGHTHPDSSVAYHIKEYGLGKLTTYPELLNPEFDQQVKSTSHARPSVPTNSPTSHDFHSVLPNYRNPYLVNGYARIWGGNLGMIISRHGYSLYRTFVEYRTPDLVSSEPGHYSQPFWLKDEFIPDTNNPKNHERLSSELEYPKAVEHFKFTGGYERLFY